MIINSNEIHYSAPEKGDLSLVGHLGTHFGDNV